MLFHLVEEARCDVLGGLTWFWKELILSFFSFFFTVQFVFAVFTGEAWGYLGSRKFLQELDLGSYSVKGLSMSMIEQVTISSFFPFV